MLFAGELAVRKVSEMESTLSLPTSRFSFRLTARVQVIWNCLAFSASVLTSPPHLQLLLIVLSMLITAASVRSLQAKHGLPRVNQAAGWAIFRA